MRPSGRISILVAALLGLAVSASPASAAPQGPWVQPAFNLSVTGQDAYGPQITTALDGTATAVWYRDNGSDYVIQAATRQPGGSFGTPFDLSTGQDADSPQITTAPDGTTTSAWRRWNGSNYIIQATTRPPGGSFGTPVDLSAIGQDAEDPQITTATDGTTTAVWERYNGSDDIIQAAVRPPGGSFGAPVDLSAPGQAARSPQITTAPDGTTTAIWRRSDGSDNIVQTATRPPGGSFGAPVDLSDIGQDAFSPRITAAPDGTATAVWRRSDGSNAIIQAATRPPGGSFGVPEDLSAPGQNADAPRITTAPDGTATAAWTRDDGSHFIMQAATRPPGGSFGAPVDLSAPGRNAFTPQITTASDGTTTSVWSRYNGSNYIIQAATRPPGGSFGAPENLSATGGDADDPQITTAADGSVTAVWYRSNSSNDIIQAIFTARPSVLLGVETNGGGTGTVSSAPSGIDCGDDCAESYPSFTRVTLTATADAGSTFGGWGGACEGSEGNDCELTMLDGVDISASFEVGEPKLKITRLKPKKPKVKRSKTVKIKVTGKNIGDATAKNAKLCLKIKKGVRMRLKPKGRTCQKLGSLAPGQAKKKPFKLKAIRKAEKGKKYKIKFKLSAANARTVARAVKVKVK